MLEAGALFDRYRIDARLGEGGMAEVFRVQHVQLGTWHALKVLKTGFGRMNARLIQEGRVQAQLRHPNVVTVSDILDVNGAPGLLMEYVRGPSLEALLDHGRISLADADAIARGVLAGVAAAHAEGMVHRDLKPANILLATTRAGLVPKVADFGLAKLLDDESVGTSLTRTGSTMGTPAYMSPEQIRNAKNVDRRTDVFALGAILYELVCWERTFPSDDIVALFSDIAAGKYVPPRSLCPALPERMEAAIVGALQPDRENRIASVEQLLEVWSGTVAAQAGLSASSATPSRKSYETWAGEEDPPASSAFANPSLADGSAGPVSIDVSFWRETLAPAVDANRPPSGRAGQAARPDPVQSITPSAAPRPTADRTGSATFAADPAELDAPAATPPGTVTPGSPRWVPIAAGVVALMVCTVGITAWMMRAPAAPASTPAPSAPIAMDPGTAAGTNGSDAAGSAVPGTAGTPGVPAPGTGAAGAAPTQTTPVSAVASPPIPAAGTSTPRSPASASSSTRATAPATSAASAGASAPAGGSARTDAAPATAPTTPTPVPAAVAPSPVASAAPAPAPAAEDAIPAGKARVHLQGDAKSVWLQSAGGNFRPGLVPVGTYRIQVFFEGMAAQSVGEVTVGEGEERTIVCHKALSNCKVQ